MGIPSIEREGKFYWFAAVEHQKGRKAIGVAIADNPRGPFKDATGAALVTNNMTTETKITLDDIVPSVIIDDDVKHILFWGNTACYYTKLKPNMIEFEGSINAIKELPSFTEALWVHKIKGWYYSSYAIEFPEKIAYSMRKNIRGPWEYKGIIN